MRCFALARCYDATSYDATAQGDEVGATEQGVRERLRRKAASADLLCQWQPRQEGSAAMRREQYEGKMGGRWLKWVVAGVVVRAGWAGARLMSLTVASEKDLSFTKCIKILGMQIPDFCTQLYV